MTIEQLWDLDPDPDPEPLPKRTRRDEPAADDWQKAQDQWERNYDRMGEP